MAEKSSGVSKNVLLLTDVNFWEKSSGNRSRILHLITFLADHVNLQVVNTGPVTSFTQRDIICKDINAKFHILEEKRYLNSNGYGRRLAKFIKDKKFDAAIIEYIHSSYFLEFLPTDIKVILDSHDIISKRTNEFKKFDLGGALFELSEAHESQLLRCYDHVMAICKPDALFLNKIIGKGRTLLCPHPPVCRDHTFKPVAQNIVFIASAYLPNVDAIHFFIKECWPAIHSRYQAELMIYGTVCSSIQQEVPGVVLKGFTDDLDDAYALADICINPVRFGAGLKIKNVEALANGLPLVTTKHGARGIEDGIDSAFLVAETAGEIIRTVSKLIDSPQLRRDLKTEAGNFIRERFSALACFSPLLTALNKK